MLRLVGLVVSIGLADSLNPSTVGPALLLAGEPHAIRNVLRFTLGTFAVFFLAGAIITIGPGAAIFGLLPHPGPTVRYIAETVIGAGMLIASVVLWRCRVELGRRANEDRPRSRGRSPFLLGLTISVVELPTAFPYFAVLVAIIGSGLGIGRQLLLVGLYNLCFVVPLLLIAVVLRVVGERATEVIRQVRDWLHRHWPVLVATVALLAGAFVLALGATGLMSGAKGQVGSVSRKVRKVISQ